MRELSKVEMEQISGGCLTDIVTGVNTAFRLISDTLNTLFSGSVTTLLSNAFSTLLNTATNIITSSRKS
ncbi:hypothetical protein [Xylella fastidiosa]|nr:hypothetical protein [Xylella fastidiosa]KAJ4852223.1 hypothetical protein XYFPCFBP8418_010120 [Xylella fastidiosa subsp. multiplex]MBE0268849.1 hypothetical protein [Xylella fastidiosa subsp. multiplex]MBE0276058.1 hypothetical protein [Xylella fastidiosa subsp. multiplex]MBE0277735.1 hypothetical protein [Xylella fastidiosa subsp. multiplex]MBE0282312.1 hypothetical protein [Xylella fastidiosa subsp. multiplex]